VRVVGGEERDRPAVERAEAGRRVGHALADDGRDDPREDPDPDPARARRAIGAVAGEPRADDDIRAVIEQRAEDERQLRRVVLAVAVNLHRDVEAVLEGVPVPGLDGAADPEVERQPDDVRAARLRHGGGGVDRGVVDDHDLHAGVDRAQLVDHSPHVRLLIQRRDDGEAAEPGEALDHGAAGRSRSRGDLSHGRQLGRSGRRGR
jgi:hypothetical protein